MPRRAIVVHAMKVTARTGQVQVLSVAFIERSIPLAGPFREELRRRLVQLEHQYGRFTITSRQTDWIVAFTGTFPERELDKMLNEIATQLGAMMFIEPGIPLSEMTGNPSDFNFIINTRRRRPSN